MKGRTTVAIVISALMVLGVTLASKSAYAHTFSGDESASFLATVEVIKVHLNLAKSDFASNSTLSTEHVEHAAAHLDNDTIKELKERNNRIGTDLPASLQTLQQSLESGNATSDDVSQQVADISSLLDEAVTVRVEKAQLTNSTVQGTMLADFVDEILESYNGAYGVEEEDSMNMTTNGTSGSMDSMTTAGTENHTAIVNTMDYEGAQAMAARAQELFSTKLKALAAANSTPAVTALDLGLQKLKQAIDDKAPLDEVTTIVHGQVHPNIQTAYSLQVVPEFPLPALTAVMGIASLVAFSAFKRRFLK